LKGRDKERGKTKREGTYREMRGRVRNEETGEVVKRGQRAEKGNLAPTVISKSRRL